MQLKQTQAESLLQERASSRGSLAPSPAQLMFPQWSPARSQDRGREQEITRSAGDLEGLSSHWGWVATVLCLGTIPGSIARRARPTALGAIPAWL